MGGAAGGPDRVAKHKYTYQVPTDPSKHPQQILAIPGTPSGAQLVALLNDRIDQVNLAFAKFVQNPALGDVDLAQAKIVDLADPKDDLDAVNLRTLKKFGAVSVDTGTGKGSGIEFPTIYFTFDGFPFDGEESPFAIIMPNRDGFSPTQVSLSAVGVPTSVPCEVNLTIQGVDMLRANLALPVGSQGPVFSADFALPGSLRSGTLIMGVIVKAGGTTQLTIGLSLRGH